jgi:peptidoglycan-N-acetylglucosamine deacetylase
MFGGVGLCRRSRFFALIAGDTLYLKVDDTTRADYEAERNEALQALSASQRDDAVLRGAGSGIGERGRPGTLGAKSRCGRRARGTGAFIQAKQQTEVHVKRIPIVAAVFAAVSIASAASMFSSGQQPPSTAPPSWTLTEDQIREVVNRVRAGRDLTPKAWPGGARVAVGLSFDLDNETGSLRDNITSPSLLSQGEYGSRAGLPRVLALLDRHQIAASFFVPAVSALLHQDSMKAIIASRRHEVGLHGWIHERNSQLDRATERDLLGRAAKTLETITGARPAGMRTPSWDYSPHTIEIAKELGLVYDSSLMADDRPYEVLAAGQPTGIVELPVEWILDDYPYFWMDRPSTVRPTMTPDEVFSIWKAEFDGAYDERGMFILTMHPHVIGHRARAAMLERLITYMKSKPGVWFATHEQIARHVKGQGTRDKG